MGYYDGLGGVTGTRQRVACWPTRWICRCCSLCGPRGASLTLAAELRGLIGVPHTAPYRGNSAQ